MTGKLTSGWSSVLITGIKAASIAQRNLETPTLHCCRKTILIPPYMASPKTFFVPNISPSLPPGTLGRPSHKMSLFSSPCNSLASTSIYRKDMFFSHNDPPQLNIAQFFTRGFFFKANLHDNITNEEGRLDTLLLVQSPSNLGAASLLRT